MKNKVALGTALTFVLLTPFTAKAMHISEGFLPPLWCLVYFIMSAPFFIRGLVLINRKTAKNKDLKMLLALAAAFCFVLSAVKLPSVAGSSSHPTGTGFGTIIFGPWIMAVIGSIVLLLQVIFMGHGGITTLGANVFSMAVAGPLAAFAVYRLLRNKNKKAAVFIASALGNLTTYTVTALQLALAFPAEQGGFFVSFGRFLAIFALTQLPLALVEGFVTTAAFNFIEKIAAREFKALSEEGL